MFTLKKRFVVVNWRQLNTDKKRGIVAKIADVGTAQSLLITKEFSTPSIKMQQNAFRQSCIFVFSFTVALLSC
jgi:hypothetical protein